MEICLGVLLKTVHIAFSTKGRHPFIDKNITIEKKTKPNIILFNNGRQIGL